MKSNIPSWDFDWDTDTALQDGVEMSKETLLKQRALKTSNEK